MHNTRLLLSLIILLLFGIGASAQNLNLQNFSNIQVDDLSDQQIRQMITQIESAGLPESQLEQIAAARGMAASEIRKLRLRITAIKAGGTRDPAAEQKGKTEERKVVIDEEEARPETPEKEPLVFGKELFSNRTITFEPNLRLATPLNYVIGTADQLLIDIYGYAEVSYQLTVSPEGHISLPYVGLVPVSGLTIEAATSKIRVALSGVYPGLKTGNTKLSVALGNIRSIKVILTGEVTQPGTYSLPSLATVFNALYSSGGPTEKGSFRAIEVIRDGKKIAELDVYDFLLNGDLKNNLRLKDQDIVRIPTYRKRVEISGEVKRPAIFEMKEGENFTDLLGFAGGFTENAYQARIKVLKNTATERRIRDLEASDFQEYTPEGGDNFFVDKILDRFENRVKLDGAVFRPGFYELTPGLTFLSLIKKAEGLKEDAFLNRAYITRLLPDNRLELISVDIAGIMSGAQPDIPLKREDVISIASVFDLKEEQTVTIDGDVRNPGAFAFVKNMSLEELIIKAGGLRESANPYRIEVARRIISEDKEARQASARTAQVFQVVVNRDLNPASGFMIQPFDMVTVRTAPGYEVQRQVRIEGEVLYPGVYTITHKGERISDLLRRAGGVTELAYTPGASLKREGRLENQLDREKEELKVKQLKKTQDTLDVSVEDKTLRNDFVGIDLENILKSPGKPFDLFLEQGDIISVPKELQTIRVSGEVLAPRTMLFAQGKRLKSYIRGAGGFSAKARKSGAYVVYANGAVKSARKYLFFTDYPAVKTGSEIFIPKTEEKRKMTAAERVGMVTGLASMGAIVLGIINLIK
ncbi:MAG: SLBB domain-containing protein [Leadbetterella sp.]|nr:SLBB domain-containing protein [Leadbetterella sp.]